MYRVSIKSNPRPATFVDISLLLQISTRNFTQLLNDKICFYHQDYEKNASNGKRNEQ